MNTNYSLLFYLKKPKNYVNGPKPNRVKGQKEQIRDLNAHLDTLERNIEDVHSSLVKQGVEITSELMKLKYLGKDVIRYYLMEVFDEHNTKMEALLGKGFQPNTLKGYRAFVSHLTEYLQKNYSAKDIDVRNIDHAFITGPPLDYGKSFCFL